MYMYESAQLYTHVHATLLNALIWLLPPFIAAYSVILSLSIYRHHWQLRAEIKIKKEKREGEGKASIGKTEKESIVWRIKEISKGD